MSRLPVLWLCGPPGVGKSTAAWALFTEYAARGIVSGYVDIDQLGMRFPAPADDPDNTVVKAANLSVVLGNYQAAGATRGVVSGVVLPSQVPEFTARADGAAISWVRLYAEAGTLHDRFLGRDGPPELLADVDRHADLLADSRFGDVSIDVTGIGVSDLVNAIEAALPGWPNPTSQPDRSGSSRAEDVGSETARNAPPRVLLLCGPRAVGTSTVGWEVFQRLLESRTAAFVDLAQVGFVGEPSADPLGRHHLRAGNLAAMAPTYQQGGASVVVAVGSVADDGEIGEYVTALPAGSLTVCRLHATPKELKRRIGARTAPQGGPHLAGDDLRGSPVAVQEHVLNQALSQARRLEGSRFADLVLGTTNRSVSQCATVILNYTDLVDSPPSDIGDGSVR